MRGTYPLNVMCEVYSVSRFGYASWKRRGLSKRAKQDVVLAEKIETLFCEFDGIYGSPKIHAELKSGGETIGLNKVARLMREAELKARAARIYRSHATLDRFYASFKNEIHDLEATGPDQIWVGDVTYLYVNGQPRYLAVVLDKYSRRIIGWSLSKKRNAELTLTAIKHAANKRVVAAGLYFHSDRGQEYLATKYRDWLKENGVIQSANRKGVMNDNAEMESFFRQFKTERIHRNEFITEKELRGVITEYVHFYNQKRIHSSLNYMTPVQYEVRIG
jgi:putative transposase